MPPSRLTNARGPFSVEFIKMTGNRFKAVPEIYTRSPSLSKATILAEDVLSQNREDAVGFKLFRHEVRV